MTEMECSDHVAVKSVNERIVKELNDVLIRHGKQELCSNFEELFSNKDPSESDHETNRIDEKLDVSCHAFRPIFCKFFFMYVFQCIGQGQT